MNTISLVTGGNRGIGREGCRQLAARGHTVILTARSADRAARAARAVGAVPLQLDVTDADSAAAAARWVRDRFGQLDVLVNNAAICYDTWQRAATADLAVVREAAETNLYGPWLMVQAFLPLLHRRLPPVLVSYHGREDTSFSATIAQLRQAGLPLSSDEVTARDTFQRLRVRYAPYANAITELLLCDLGSYQPDPLPGR